MDWKAVAEQVVAVLLPVAPVLTLAANEALKALGKQFGEVSAKAALEKGKALWARIKARFAKDKEVTQTMALFADNPEAFETALARVLEKRLAQDEDFGREIGSMLAEAVADKEVATFLVHVHGRARVNQIINMGEAKAREMRF